MGKNQKLTIPAILQRTVENYGQRNALATVGQTPKTYNQLDKEINALISMLEACEIKQGDKIGILSANMPNWGVAYFALNRMGVVVVPMLPDFSATEIDNILNHAEVKAIFISNNLRFKLDEMTYKGLAFDIAIEDFKVSNNKATFHVGDMPKGVYNVNEEDLASIIYTSGTTGSSKGVMLTQKNIAFNAKMSSRIQEINENDRFLSILPLSHAYENTIGFILPMSKGACVYYLSKPPTPTVLLPALKEVKPTLMLSVPLIIEKIYKSKVLSEVNKKKTTRMLYKVGFIRKKIHAMAGKKLMDTFGGELKFFGIGGAKLDAKVERFLREAKFPYAIGYGLTETAPLLAGANPQVVKYQSTGPAIDNIELKINDPDPKTGEGEIWARGANVMTAYYKEPKITKEVLTPDGWFRTGDLGILDKDNHLFIKGRLKNMIVGPSGENIYPEEIESVINNFRYVVESLVVQKKGKLVAMVHFDHADLEKRYNHLKEEVEHFVEQKVEDLKSELHTYINARVNKFSKVQLVVVQPTPFVKTATQKIKRYMYA